MKKKLQEIAEKWNEDLYNQYLILGKLIFGQDFDDDIGQVKIEYERMIKEAK